MTSTSHHDERIAQMTFASVYPHYVNKVERKGGTEADLIKVITWLTGFNEKELKEQMTKKSTFRTFFEQATLHPASSLITGTICGYKIQDIENPLTKKVRYLDKLVDELANGKKMEKILRSL